MRRSSWRRKQSSFTSQACWTTGSTFPNRPKTSSDSVAIPTSPTRPYGAPSASKSIGSAYPHPLPDLQRLWRRHRFVHHFDNLSAADELVPAAASSGDLVSAGVEAL